MNRPQESRICMNGLFNYLVGCMGKKYLLVESEGGGAQEGWIVFLKCVLTNYRTIWVGAGKFSSLHMINPLWAQWQGLRHPHPLKKRLNWQGLPPVMTRSPSTKIG